MKQSTTNSRDINATPDKIFEALTDPTAIVKWQVPGDMTAKIHDFELAVGSGYQMSLFYPESETTMKGKTGNNEDRFTAKFVEIIPNRKIVQAVSFETSDPQLTEEMIFETTLHPVDNGTKVTFSFRNIPSGIKPEDNENGAMSSLEKLAKLVEE